MTQIELSNSIMRVELTPDLRIRFQPAGLEVKLSVSQAVSLGERLVRLGIRRLWIEEAAAFAGNESNPRNDEAVH